MDLFQNAFTTKISNLLPTHNKAAESYLMTAESVYNGIFAFILTFPLKSRALLVSVSTWALIASLLWKGEARIYSKFTEFESSGLYMFLNT